MIAYRIVGALLLALSGGWGAYLMNQRITLTLRQTEAWLALLRYVKTQVDCFALPGTRILKGVDPALLRACGYEAESPPDSFLALLGGCGIRDRESERILSAFAREFGRSYREEQTKGCAYYCELLAARRDALAEGLPARKKVNSTLWISGALAMVILLI